MRIAAAFHECLCTVVSTGRDGADEPTSLTGAPSSAPLPDRMPADR